MKEELEQVLELAFKNLGYDKENAKIKISNRPELCDFQINSVFKLAKEQKKSPVDIGSEIVEEIKKLDNINYYLEDIQFVSPGFINLTISNEFLTSKLNKTIESKNFGIDKIKEDITCVVDYGGPNIAKPLHVGHLRPAIVGESINRILKAKGYRTISDVHLGDIGLQMGQVIYGLKERNLLPKDITIELLQEIYPKQENIDM